MLPSTNDTVTVRELTDLLLATPSFEEYAQRIVEMACERVIPGAVCGLTMVIDAKARTVASSGDLAGRADEIQYGTGEGPCLHAIRTSSMVMVTDLALDDRWGPYRRHALDRGVRASLSVPIIGLDEAAVGALNLYLTEPADFGTDQVGLGRHFADQAAGALMLGTRLAEQATLTAQLQEAMASRSVIDQAIGIVMSQNRCSSTEAFDVLRRASQNRNVKIRVLATDIVRTLAGPPVPSTPRKT